MSGEAGSPARLRAVQRVVASGGHAGGGRDRASESTSRRDDDLPVQACSPWPSRTTSGSTASRSARRRRRRAWTRCTLVQGPWGPGEFDGEPVDAAGRCYDAERASFVVRLPEDERVDLDLSLEVITVVFQSQVFKVGTVFAGSG